MDILAKLTSLPAELANEIVSYLSSAPSASIMSDYFWFVKLLEGDINLDETIQSYNEYKRQERLSDIKPHPCALMLSRFMYGHNLSDVHEIDFPAWFQEQMFEDHVQMLQEDLWNELHG